MQLRVLIQYEYTVTVLTRGSRETVVFDFIFILLIAYALHWEGGLIFREGGCWTGSVAESWGGWVRSFLRGLVQLELLCFFFVRGYVCCLVGLYISIPRGFVGGDGERGREGGEGSGFTGSMLG